MYSVIACHIPVRRSRVQIGFDQISPSALRTIMNNLGARLDFSLRRTQCNQPAINIILVSYLVISNVINVLYVNKQSNIKGNKDH